MSRLPEGIVNGPSRSEHLENGVQSWERPWTLEEMRQSSANWSLAADSGLFLFLQEFSQRMLSKTHDIEKQLDSLIRDTKNTDSCLHSVFNDFLMLSNTQFIENRVYDEEVEETIPKVEALEKQPEQEKTREQKEAELIPKMQEAVNHGLKVLESAFEHLDIKAGNSDSEDEEVTDRLEAILEPKDLYVDRPLPYLIGSQAFMNQEDVGLGDLSSDEMSVDSERDSVIDGEDAVHSDDDLNQEEEERHNNIRKKPSMVSYDDDDDEEEEEDSDIFGESDGEDNDDDTKNTASSSFADELAARIKGEPVTKPEGDRASLTSKKKSKSRKEPKPAKPEAAEEDSDDMFKPPKMEDEDFSPFGGKGGLFSGGRGLFDDDDEGDLFSDAPNPPASEEKKVQNERIKTTAKTAESEKPGKKIPVGGISKFPADTLFKSVNNSDAVESKENGTQAPKINAASKQTPPAAVGGVGGGLFDDEEEEEEEDDFFSSKSLSKSDSAGKKTPKAVDLFDEDDDGGDIFSEKSSAPTPAQSKKEVVEEQVKQPERKMPAGAISIFGPGTQSLLNEGLKKRQQSTSEESEKSEENGPAPDAPKAAVKPTIKPKSRGLFSDEEDIQKSPTIPRSQSKPEFTSQSKTSKAPLSLFDDEEEEDLFASAAKSKSKPNPAKASTPQPSKAFSSSLFSDDEDQWESSKSSAGKSEVKTGGMKPSVSAPSSFLSAIIPQKGSIFDDDDDDLFTPTMDSSQNKFQRVALLFEDEDDGEDKGSLFGDKPPVNRNTAAPAAKTPAVASQSSSLLEKSEEVVVSKPAAKDKPSLPEKPTAKSPEPLPSAPSPEISESKKKPVGGVSLFGGIDVFANKQTKSPLDEVDQEDPLLSEDGPPPNVQEEEEEEERKEEKVKINTVSLFDDEEEDESDWNEPIFTPSKPTESNTVKQPTEERAQAKSTGVFLDEELLFSQTQQKDNDPDVDLFATSGKPASSKPDSVKPAAKGLFSDEDEDDLFSSIKAKDPPPRIAEKPSKPNDKAPLASPESVSEIQKPAPSPVKPKDSSSRIGKLQANLMINPAALLPGAAPSMPGASSGMATSSSSGVSSSSLSPSPVTTPVGGQTDSEGGVSFETPVQVATLQSVHKSRVKGSAQRRPQSRAGRQQPAQQSSGDKEEALGGDVPEQSLGVSGLALPPPDKSSQKHASPTLPDPASPSALPASSPSPSSVSEVPTRPSVLTLPVSTNAVIKDSSKDSSSTKVLPFSDDEDLFGSDSLFAASSVTNTPPTRQTTKTTQPETSSSAVKKDSSLFDANTDELFKKVKPRSTTKKATASSFLEEEDEDEDIFGVSNRSTPTSTSSKEIKNGSFSKQDIFQDEVAIVPEVHKKHKEKTLDASLFDDNIDIFADMTDSFKPKQKSKTKGETKSIFDDDMDDIFSPSTAKAVTKPPHKSKKTPPSQETSTAAESSNIFDDPLNALGGN
ncbi:WASH complex subunit FAM21 isoform X1 [Notothenia coriiceps]|uniref:WASH complex subunit FAM21 isoform X1 n=1 Tax=Notothenia coriiceps TaxID=8208 RepID=A0A6I9MPM0_9TELE|nr:PREDICTED: WASH complex subunit FAM21-like isoform X1 [Notothenia coriiceps]